MSKLCKFLMMLIIVAGMIPVPTVQAANGSERTAARTGLGKGETCKPRWPYIVLTCIA